jgi:hypothetical protein
VESDSDFNNFKSVDTPQPPEGADPPPSAGDLWQLREERGERGPGKKVEEISSESYLMRVQTELVRRMQALRSSTRGTSP